MMSDVVLRRLIALAFTASGFSALAYQVAWQRVLTQAIGSDAVSVILIVTIFMASLGIGTEIARKLLARPNLHLASTYALIEVGIGLYGLISLPLLRVANGLWASYGWNSLIADSALNFILLAPPIIGMGMTTPLIVQLAKRRLDDLGRVTGLLYGLNILGAALGAIITGLVLIEAVGLQGTVIIAAAINLGIAAVLFMLLRGNSSQSVSQVSMSVVARIKWPYVVSAVLFGFGTLAIQIIMFRVLINYFTMATVVFPMVLGAYLLLMASGQALGGRLADRYHAHLPTLLCALFAMGSILVLLSLRFPPAWAALWGIPSFTTFNGSLIQSTHPHLIGDPNPWIVFAFSVVFMAAVVAWSALFPVMLRLVTVTVDQAGATFARLYALYTVGNVYPS
jgi:spermidine synthase